MNVTKCVNGHFYDADKYQVCPHCGAASGGSTASSSSSQSKSERGVFAKSNTVSSGVEMHHMPDESMGKTFGVFQNEKKEKPISFETVTKKCPSCGFEISATAKFCKACGAKIPDIIPEVKTPEYTSQQKGVFSSSVDVFSNSGDAEENTENDNSVVTDETVVEPETVDTSADFSISSADEPEVEDETVQDDSDSLQNQIKSVTANNDGKTIGFFSTGEDEENCDPVVGWLVCLKGNHIGESFNIVAGRNAVGRGISNKIVLSKDNTVSREKHAWITYDPKHRVFYVQPGESSGLSYLNGETLMESKKIVAKDILEFGNGTYMLVPLCGEDFSWEEYIKE